MVRVIVVSLRDGYIVNGTFVHSSRVAPPSIKDAKAAREHIELKLAVRVISGEED